MMTDQIQVWIGEEELTCPAGTSWYEISRNFENKTEAPIALVRVNGKLRELYRTARGGDHAEFVTLREDSGYAAWKRSVLMLMLKVMYENFRDSVDLVNVHFLKDNDYFCTITGPGPVTQEWLDLVAEKMRETAAQRIPIRKHAEETSDVVAKFEKKGIMDKASLFRFRMSSTANLYTMGEYEDYYYGYMLYDTSLLTCFELRAYEDGFFLRLPSRHHPGVIREFVPEKKSFTTQWESEIWAERQGIPMVGALNEYIVDDDTRAMILTQEAYHEKKIAEIAQEIASDPRRRIILIAGPSSSGKTTFSHRLSTQLSVHGLHPHPIAVDDYFVDREHTPKDENGQYDFECLEAIDVEQFNKDMLALLDGETVELPSFNFQSGKREYKGKFKKLGEGDILVIEGIHGLNPLLTEKLPSDSKFRIYISALTQLNIDGHNTIPAADGRLLRRIVRDARTRGYDAKHTIAMWSSVKRGEERYIYPFREEADVMFNSALIYELSVLKVYAEPLLFSVKPSDPEYEEAKRLLKFVHYFLPMASEDIPNNSLIREFIGGGCFGV